MNPIYPLRALQAITAIGYPHGGQDTGVKPPLQR
ncbi:predicted protein [Plenodomus lingam JN3]|uniref:Predicted protein n=1 Tax=Leptosphaeria maculans (strain JN3 / isolate v23.1.3 / race Av1-4-5-6-7-8) TaxID=985895 RepID=E5A0L6_LEPMJ|nr:predicted protein [Plenodomus lingam JN3]CBX97076.1 predicted protein [Plenodomus lingam JN3]